MNQETPTKPKKVRKPKPKKYSKGKRIESMSELVEYLSSGTRYVMLWERPLHVGWVQSMTFRTLVNLVEHRNFSEAILNVPEVKDV